MTSSTSVKHCNSRRSNDDNEKYSLRQRHKRSTVRSKLSPLDNNAKSSSSLDSSSLLLSSSSSSSFDDNFEVITKTVASGSSASTKTKTKAAPLSKYRRKTANARERTRMKEINSAFEVLRKCVPQSVSGSGDNIQTNEKLTKITTLRLAMTYIGILSNALEDHTPFDVPPRIEDIDDHSYCSSDHFAEVNKVLGKGNAKQSNKKPKKRQTKAEKQKHKQKQQQERRKQKDVSSSLSPTSFNVNVNTTPSPMNDYHSINSILLESDGESLHLSETCLSPLSNGFNSTTPTSMSSASSPSSSSSTSSSSSSSHLNNPLQLKLLLETEDHHPPSLACISPLETLDTFNPFGDLLYTELSDFYLT